MLFRSCFKRDPRDGYARGFQSFLEKVKDGTQFLAEIIPTSDRSGAAMRASCIGLYKDVSQVLDRSIIQAKITHNTYNGTTAAQASSLLTHYLFNGETPNTIGDYLNTTLPFNDWNQDWVGRVSVKGIPCVRAAITAVKRNTKLSALLKECIAFSGDTDTVATIAMSAASCSPHYEKDLPDSLVVGLENESYGSKYLLGLDEQLLSKFKR